MNREPPAQSKIKIYGPPIAKTLTELEKIAKEIPAISEGLTARGMIPSGEVVMGDFDFVFYWAKSPDEKQLRELISEIDGALKDLSCRYTITTVEASSYPYRDLPDCERT
ncbi:MAG: hypothetical protein ABIK28_12965 [Planctomycetota bacterium]